MKHTEHKEQVSFVMRARHLYKGLIVYAVPNGGKRDPGEARRLKAEGVLSGVPDIVVAEACGIYHGLYIEFKTPTGRLSKTQKELIPQLRGKGYCVEVARSCDEAWGILEEYLNSADR